MTPPYNQLADIVVVDLDFDMIIDNWLYQIITALQVYSLRRGVNLDKYIARFSFLSDYELYNPRLMFILFDDIKKDISSIEIACAQAQAANEEDFD